MASLPSGPLAQMASTAASLVLPNSLFRSSVMRNGSEGMGVFSSNASQLLLCSCCQEPREGDQLLVLPDSFRSNSESAYVCVFCHEYVNNLLEMTKAGSRYVQGWGFKAPLPINLFELKTQGLLQSMTDTLNKEEVKKCLPFVPKLAIEMVNRTATLLPIPHATVLILDVSGYTALAEELANRLGEGNIVGQASGAEALVSEGLNLYFETLVRTVHGYGGDVIKFAGDALICLFCPSTYNQNNELRDSEDTRSAARNAVFCATAAAQTLTHAVAIHNANEEKQLTCHCGVATGEVLAWSVGDTDRREILLTGDVIRIAGDALDLASSRSVVIDQSTYELVSEWVVSHPVGLPRQSQPSTGVSSQQRIDKLRKVFGNPHLSVQPRPSSSAIQTDFHQIDFLTALSFINPRSESGMAQTNAQDVSECAQGSNETGDTVDVARLHATESDTSRVSAAAIISFLSKHVPKPARQLNVVNEMRRVTTVFTKIFHVNLVDNNVGLQDLFRDCQHVVESSGGLIRQFIVDDKGCVLISVFGVASYADVDDTTRALTAAVRLGHELPVPSSSGVATGVVFVGIVGWPKVRCEFAVVGDSVNLAARLMSLAAKAGQRETRCDEETAMASSDRIVFEELEPVLLKGKSKPTRIFNPTIAKSGSLQLSAASTKSIVTLLEKDIDPDEFFVGRDELKKQVRRYLGTLKAESNDAPPSTMTTSVLLAVGQSGFGKSRLLSWIETEFNHEACIIRPAADGNLAHLVELVVSKALSDDPQSLKLDRAEFQASVIGKLRRRRGRSSVNSVATDDAGPMYGRVKSDRGRVFSISSSALSPSNAAYRRQFSNGFDWHSPFVPGEPPTSRQEHAHSLESKPSNEFRLPSSGGGFKHSNPGSRGLDEISVEELNHFSPSIQHYLMSNSEQLFDRLFTGEGSYAATAGVAERWTGLELAMEQVYIQVLEMLLLSYVRELRLNYSRVLFLLDDADSAPEVVVKSLLMMAQHSGVGLVATLRTENPCLFSGKHRTVVRLGPISDDDIKMVVRHRFSFQDCPDPVWQCILNGSKGNPLQACEWFRAILRQQFIVQQQRVGGLSSSSSAATASEATTTVTYVLNPSKSSQELQMVTPLEGEILFSFDADLSAREKDILRKCTVICSTDSPHAVITASLLRNFDPHAESLPSDADLTAILDRLSCTSFTDEEEDPMKVDSSYLRRLPSVGTTTSGTLKGSFALATTTNNNNNNSVLSTISSPVTSSSMPLSPLGNASVPKLSSTRSLSASHTKPPSKYVFANEIVRNVIYKTMTFAERSRFHLKVAAWLQETRSWDLGVAPIIVHHLLSGGERRQAFEFLRSIGELLLKSGSFIEAVSFVRQTIVIGRSLLAHELIERREIFELELSLVLAEISSLGAVSNSALFPSWIQQIREETAALSLSSSPLSPAKHVRQLPPTSADSEHPQRRSASYSQQHHAHQQQQQQQQQQQHQQRSNSTNSQAPLLPAVHTRKVSTTATASEHHSQQQQSQLPLTLPASPAAQQRLHPHHDDDPSRQEKSNWFSSWLGRFQSSLPSSKEYDRFFSGAKLSNTALGDIRRFCVIQIWYAMSVTGDASMLVDGFNHLKASFPVSLYPKQRLFLSLLSSGLCAPLQGRPSNGFDVVPLEHTVDLALQLACPEVACLGMFATSLCLLLFRKPFVAERIAKGAFAKLKDAVHHHYQVSTTTASDENLLPLDAAAPAAHSLQLVVISQAMCGALLGATQTVSNLVDIAKGHDLVKILAWAQCTSSLLRFKIQGFLVDEPDAVLEQLRLMFDSRSLSEVDGIIALASMALSSTTERGRFSITDAQLETLRTKRFTWWLGECFEAIIYCGLVTRASWTLKVLDEFLSYANSTMTLCVPVALRLMALVRAQRGDDKLALKALMKAKDQAKKYNLLFEAKFCEFLFRRVFSDQAGTLASTAAESALGGLRRFRRSGRDQNFHSDSDDFRVFGCTKEFADNMTRTVREWIAMEEGALSDDEERWTKAKKSLKTISITSGATSCLPSSWK